VRFGGSRSAALEGREFLLQIGVHRDSPGMLRPGKRAIRIPGRRAVPDVFLSLVLAS